MEYLLGLVVGGALVIAYSYISKTIIDRNKLTKPVVTQSRSFAMIRPFISGHPIFAKPLDTQATRFFDNSRMKILYTNDFAYWIEDNAVFRAQIKDNLVLQETKEKLDIIGMDKVELEEMIFIIETLTEGKRDDRGYPGNQKF